MKILITGGEGKLAKKIIQSNRSRNHDIVAPPKGEMNIKSMSDITFWVGAVKPDVIIHTAALTRPMNIHDNNPLESLHTNIVGTSHVTATCIMMGIKLVYISTDFVYPGLTGDYKEEDPILPTNKYAWSKLGGECAVRMHDNHLILRVAMCSKPFPHKSAIADSKKSLIYDDDVADIILMLLDKKGTINIGGKSSSIYEFAKKDNPDIGKIYLEDISEIMPKDTSMNLDKMKRELNE